LNLTSQILIAENLKQMAVGVSGDIFCTEIERLLGVVANADEQHRCPVGLRAQQSHKSSVSVTRNDGCMSLLVIDRLPL
jgi:hypothetical protein